MSKKKNKPTSVSDELKNDPVVLFTVMEAARRQQNYELAARMQEKLSRQGVIVKYRGSVHA